MKRLFAYHGKTTTPEYYSSMTNINITRVKNLLRILNKGGDIDKSATKKGRQRILGESESLILINTIRDNNKCSLKELQAVIAHEAGKAVSTSTIHRHLTTRMMDDGLPNITLKRFVIRGSNKDNIPDLIEQRKTVVRKLIQFQESGFRPVYVDETHWQMGLVTGRGRAPIGETPIVHMRSNSSEITIISSMCDLGMLHNQIIYGNNSIPVFTSYIRQLLEDVKHLAPVVIFLDNASIHHDRDMESVILNSGNRILYNAPYSSPLNPIEYIFGFWKKRAECSHYTTRDEVLIRIKESFKTITPAECYKTIQHVSHSVFRKVLGGEDI